MKVNIELSGEELQVIEVLLDREIAGTRVELRRTDDPGYHRRVAHELDVLRHARQAIGVAEESSDVTIG